MTFEYDAKVTISIGIAFYNNESATELIKKADDQLYRAKSLGKNRVVREEEER
jgi:diguanylate cyclase (GGDEF)-like protein